MFTLRIFNEKTQAENIFEVQGAEWFEKPLMKDGEVDTAPGLLVRYEDGGRTHYGRNDNNTRAYLMNRYGATVATYRF